MATERRRQLSDGTSGSRHRVHLLSGLPVTERRLQVAGVSTSVLEGGAGSPILFLHGPGDFAGMWMRVIPDLVTTHRIIAPDLPGHGASHLVDRLLLLPLGGHGHLHALVRAGLGKRVMFGWDQMRWPEKIGEGIDAIEQAPFLTEDQKRDILYHNLYHNAVRFLRLEEDASGARPSQEEEPWKP